MHRVLLPRIVDPVVGLTIKSGQRDEMRTDAIWSGYTTNIHSASALVEKFMPQSRALTHRIGLGSRVFLPVVSSSDRSYPPVSGMRDPAVIRLVSAA